MSCKCRVTLMLIAVFIDLLSWHRLWMLSLRCILDSRKGCNTEIRTQLRMSSCVLGWLCWDFELWYLYQSHAHSAGV